MTRWAILTAAGVLWLSAAAIDIQDLLLTGAGRPTVQAQSAPADATFLTQTTNGTLTAEQALASLSNGLLRHTSGVVATATVGTDYSAQRILRVTADRQSTSTSFADVTDLTLSVLASTTYVVTCTLSYTTAVSTTALQLAVNGPASPTALRYAVETSTTATARHNASQSAYDTVVNPATGGAATALPVTLYGTLENGSNAGTLAVRFRTEVNASAVTILRGSYCLVS